MSGSADRDIEICEVPGGIHIRAYHQKLVMRFVIGGICLLMWLGCVGLCVAALVTGELAPVVALSIFAFAMGFAPLAMWNRTTITLTADGLEYFVGPALPRWGKVARSEVAALYRTTHKTRDADHGVHIRYRLVLRKRDETKLFLGKFTSRVVIDRLIARLELPGNERWFEFD